MKNIIFFKPLTLLLLCIAFQLEIKAQAPNLMKAEYYIDTDPGFGLAVDIPTANDSNIINQTAAINLNTIGIGFHNLYIRTLDVNGKWSVSNRRSFFKTSMDINATPNIIVAEYFIDSDPGFGLGTLIPISNSSTISNQSVIINMDTLSIGFHQLFIRTKDVNGIWSISNRKSFFKMAATVTSDITQIEYFIDADPGFGLAAQIPVTPGITIANTTVALELSAVSEGFHKIYMRSKNANGVWSVTNSKTFYKSADIVIPDIVKAEYFFDTDPGFGNAIPISITNGANIDSIIINPNYCLLSFGSHQLFIRCTDANGRWSITNNKTINVQQGYYFADTDGDGYGNPNDSIAACAAPLGYVADHTDCNDTDSFEHPNQIWYTDVDADDYGTGLFVIQCSRPLHGYTSTELVSTNGDCNDNNATIHPGAQYFNFSGTPDFASTLIAPATGGAYTNFNFEVNYVDVNNVLPPITFPRVVLDYSGNNIITNPEDRIIIMSPFDVNDTNTADGKKYIATISSLLIGTNYQTSIQSVVNGCLTKIGAFNYPDVLQQPDLEIFASDISFSDPHPPVSSPLTVNATIHNESDYAAQNFVVHIRNQYDTTLVYPDITVSFLAPHSSYNVSWNITTPIVPAWCPMEVSIDYTDIIPETNELDNSAIRPFINGDFNLPGGIQVMSYVNPMVGFGGASTSLTGSAHYYGTAIVLVDSSVAGATINYTILETNASYSATTNSLGNFSSVFNNPLAPGSYHIQGTVTDFTLTGTFTSEFEVLPSPVCTYSDLRSSILATSPYGFSASNGQEIKIVVGDSLACVATVNNAGFANSDTTLLSVFNGGALPVLPNYTIPPLNVNSSSSVNFSLHYPSSGFYNINVIADAGNSEPECNESNTSSLAVQVLSSMADIVPLKGPGGTNYNCTPAAIYFELGNLGGAATGNFICHIIRKRNDTLIGVDTVLVSNIPSALLNTHAFAFSLPFAPTTEGNYTFELQCDLPNNIVLEFNESNNVALYAIHILACKPNFSFLGCEAFDVESADGDYAMGSNITLKGVLQNSGNLDYNGVLDLRYQLSGGAVFNETINVNLIPGASVPISKIITAPLPNGQFLSLIADPFLLIDELSDADNSITNKMCWDFYIDSSIACSHSTAFWERTWLVNQALYASVGVGSLNLYDADTLEIKFEVTGPGISGNINLGNAVLYNVEKTCFCPVIAYLPTSFVFPQTGTYFFTMTVDPDGKYGECSESNNVLVRSLNVVNLPDMRERSQFIAPSLLNPQVSQPVSFNITYENIGASNVNDQMKLKVLVDNTPLATINNVSGLISGDNATLNIPTTWSSNLMGVHVVRTIIDSDNDITELNELNNEATRTIVVGPAANLYFQAFSSLTLFPNLNNNISIKARVANSGDIACQGDLQVFYVNNNLDTILFHTQYLNINGHDSINLTIPWIVLDNKTTILGKIINSSALEISYDDNQAQFELGQMNLILNALPACGSANQGSITANAIGGEPPYNYSWSNGFIGATLTAPVGTYSVIVTDITGQTVTSSASIIVCPPVTLLLNLFIQGYYEGSGLMTPTLLNQGELYLANDVDFVTVELRDSISPYTMIECDTAILQTNGNLACYFSNNVNGGQYYLTVRHRNLIPTWSANPIPISTITNYIFSSDASKAYGANQIEVETGIWAMYSGDLNNDENIDLLDAVVLDTDINNFSFGYLPTDVNGDGNVDLLDSPLLESNVNNFIFSVHP